MATNQAQPQASPTPQLPPNSPLAAQPQAAAKGDWAASIQHPARVSLALPKGPLSAPELFAATALAAREKAVEQLLDTEERYTRADAKRLYYLSMEFLAGRSLENNLPNLGALAAAREALSGVGGDLETVLATEHDAALGNGGLGQLAACFIDSLASLGVLPGLLRGARHGAPLRAPPGRQLRRLRRPGRHPAQRHAPDPRGARAPAPPARRGAGDRLGGGPREPARAREAGGRHPLPERLRRRQAAQQGAPGPPDLHLVARRGRSGFAVRHPGQVADFAAYRATQAQAGKEYCQPAGWWRKAILNVARTGKFSSDRTIREYADEIWGLRSVHA